MNNQEDIYNGPVILKPCPFCGSEARSELAAGYAPQVYCTGEKCSVYIMDVKGVYLNEVEAQWNTRWSNNEDNN